MLQNQVNKDAENAIERNNREMESRHQMERDSFAARANLSSRIQHLETQLRRRTTDEQDD